MLTVPEQFAGQTMKCPLCSANFTVPALPVGGSSEPATPTTTGLEANPPAAESETYAVKNEPVPAFSTAAASNPPPPSSPVQPQAPAAPTPAFATSPPAPSSPVAATSNPAYPPPPPSSTPVRSQIEPGDGCAMTFDPQVLQWIPAAALVLVFLLQFFPWVGIYVGGREITSQGAWGTAVGSTTRPDPDLAEFFEFVSDEEAKQRTGWDEKTASGNTPQFSLLTFFYLLPWFFVTLVVTVGVVVLPFVQISLPPQVQQVLPWKWAIVAGLNALLLLFVLLQFILPFSLESRVASYVDSDPKLRYNDRDKSDVEKMKQVRRGIVLEQVQRTSYFKLVVLLHLLASLAAGMVYWIEKRGPSKPLPRLEFRW
jgi:hypothetical protein